MIIDSFTELVQVNPDTYDVRSADDKDAVKPTDMEHPLHPNEDSCHNKSIAPLHLSSLY